MNRALVVLALLVVGLVFTVTGVGAAEMEVYRGRSLQEVLLEFQDQDLPLVFSSQLVRPEMRVAQEPRGDSPREVLDALLAPFGLRIEEPVAGTWVVVRVAGVIRGLVRSAETRGPLAGVEIRLASSLGPEAGTELGTGISTGTGTGRSAGSVMAVTAVEGRFRLEGLAAGSHVLEARVRGYFPQRLDLQVDTRGGSVEVIFELQPAPFVLDEIVVRPSRWSLLRSQPAAPLALSRTEIDSLPHLGGDVFRAVSRLPGVTAEDLTARFSVRGGRRDEVEIVLDGQEIWDAFHLKDFDEAMSIVPSEGLASVSLTTGAFAADRGDRMSGVLDMTTEVPGPSRTVLSLDLLTASATRSGQLLEQRGGWLASARGGGINFASRLFGREDPSFWDVFAKGELALTDRQQLRVHTLLAGDSLDFLERDGDEVKRFDTRYDSAYAWITHQAAVGDSLLATTRGSQSRVERNRRGQESEEEQSFEVADRRTLDITAFGQTWDLHLRPGHEVKWGAEGRFFDVEYDYFNEVDLSLALDTPLAASRQPVTNFQNRFKGDHWSLFVTDRQTPWEPVTLELGGRVDHHSLTDETLWSPRAAVAWRLSRSSVLRASWGYFFQSQRPYELQVADGERSFSRAERTEHWVLGYERLFEGAGKLRALRLELYSRDTKNPRRRWESLFEPYNVFPEIEPDRVLLISSRRSSRGLELALRGRAGARTEWWVHYTGSEVEDRVDGLDIPGLRDQPHAVGVNLGTRLGRHWNLHLAWRWHLGWPTTPVLGVLTEMEEPGEDDDFEGGDGVGEDEAGDPAVLRLGAIRSERLADYHRLDLRLSRRWARPSSVWVIYLDVQNAYDHQNPSGLDLSFDDETGELNREDETWPGIFPSLGVRVEF